MKVYYSQGNNSRLFCSLIIVLLLSGCSSVMRVPVKPLPEPTKLSSTPVYEVTAITTDNAATLVEVSQFRTVSETIAAIGVTPNGQQLLAVTSPSGLLARWRLTDNLTMGNLNLGTVGLGAVTFDAERNVVTTGAGVGWAKHKHDDSYLGFRVYDTITGVVIRELLTKHNDITGYILYPRVVINPKGEWLLTIFAGDSKTTENMKHLIPVSALGPHGGCGETNLDRMPEEDDFDVVAFDATGEMYVASDQTGQVRLWDFQPDACPRPGRSVEDGGPVGEVPLALAFDPSRHWLARVRGTNLTIWDLSMWGYPYQLQTLVGDTAGEYATLEFDPSGRLLAVGTIRGWQLWDVVGKRMLLESRGGPVYALTFSADGRLFAYGDAHGLIHVLGIPRK